MLKIYILLTAMLVSFTSMQGYQSKVNQSEQNKKGTVNSVQSQQNKYVPSVMDMGIGPVKHLNLGVIDFLLAEDGRKVFYIHKCESCHSIDRAKRAPELRYITRQRSPEFIMNYLVNMNVMQKRDENIKRQIKIFKSRMPQQHITKRQARALLEYFRLLAVNKEYH